MIPKTTQELIETINKLTVKDIDDKILSLDYLVTDNELNMTVDEYIKARKHIHTIRFCKQSFK